MAGEAIAQKPASFDLQYTTLIKGWYTFFRPVRIRRTHKVPLYPPSFNKMALISSLVLELGVDEGKLKSEPVKEVMCIISRQAPVVIRIIAIATAENKSQYNDVEWLQQRIDLLDDKLPPEMASQLLMWILLAGDFINFANAIGWIIQVSVTAPKGSPIATLPSAETPPGATWT
jgi:hypothetical protein